MASTASDQQPTDVTPDQAGPDTITRKQFKTTFPKRKYQCVFFSLSVDFHELNLDTQTLANGSFLSGLFSRDGDARFGLDCGDVAVFVHTTVNHMLDASRNLLRVPGINHVVPWQQINLAKQPKTTDHLVTPNSTFVLLGTSFPLDSTSAELQNRLLVPSDFEHQISRFSTQRVALASARCLFQFTKNCLNVVRLSGPVSEVKKINHSPGYDALVISSQSPSHCWFVDKNTNAVPLSASLEVRFANWLVNSDIETLSSVVSSLDDFAKDRFESDLDRKDAVKKLKRKFCLVKNTDDCKSITTNVKLWRSRIVRRLRNNRRNKKTLTQKAGKRSRSKAALAVAKDDTSSSRVPKDDSARGPKVEKKKRKLNEKLNRSYPVSHLASEWIRQKALDLLPEGSQSADGTIFLRTQDFVKLFHAYVKTGQHAKRTANTLDLTNDPQLLQVYQSSLPPNTVTNNTVHASSIMSFVSKNLIKN